jgi:hypothetical protein
MLYQEQEEMVNSVFNSAVQLNRVEQSGVQLSSRVERR